MAVAVKGEGGGGGRGVVRGVRKEEGGETGIDEVVVGGGEGVEVHEGGEVEMRGDVEGQFGVSEEGGEEAREGWRRRGP